MEFTYNGFVRYGFGFANPNHAAAFICMLLPLLWTIRHLFNNSQIKYKILFWAITFVSELMLYVALMLTYSRTGFFVLIISFISYFCLCLNSETGLVEYLKKHYGVCVVFLGFFMGLGFLTGVISRYFQWIINPDYSILNRFRIWHGACQLLYDNPLGTATGYSGNLWSDFLYMGDKSIAFRTCMNSFLTLAVEYGIIIFSIVICMIILSFIGSFVLAKSIKDSKIKIIFVGLFASLLSVFISSNLSTPFEIIMLKDMFSDFNMNSLASFIFTFLYIILVIITIILAMTKLNNKNKILIISSFITIILISIIFIIGAINRTTRIHFQYPNITITDSKQEKQVIYITEDEEMPVKEVYKYLQHNFLNHDYCFSQETPNRIIEKYDIILLSGKSASFPPKMLQGAKVIILYPTLPPPDKFNYEIIKMELLPEHLNSFSTLWEALATRNF